MPNKFAFRLTTTDGAARAGEITTPHGVVRTPAFMPVGTQAAIKGVHHDDVHESGADILLANTYHLMLRPSAERVAALGGLHSFMRWPYPILTDSGGFQVMSLANLRKVEEEGVTFRSHLDGALIALTPERAVEVQILLGSDIAMQLDECVRLPAERSEIERAMQLSLRWAERGKRACAGRYRLRRLCARRPRRRRDARGDAQGRRRDRTDAAGRQAALSDGRRYAGRHSRGDRPRHRYVRLRPADAQRPPWAGVHAQRRDQHQERSPCRGSQAARRREPLPGGARLFPRLSASPVPQRRGARRHAVVDRQSLLLPGLDGGGAHSHRGRAFRRLSRAKPRAMGRQGRPAGIVNNMP